jgi:hypothetical protein
VENIQVMYLLVFDMLKNAKKRVGWIECPAYHLNTSALKIFLRL